MGFKQEILDFFFYYAWCADGTEKIRRMSIQSRQRLASNGSVTLPLNEETHVAGKIESIEIPETKSESKESEKIDESHTTKKLTIITDRMIRKFSGSVCFFLKKFLLKKISLAFSKITRKSFFFLFFSCWRTY